MKNRVDRGPLGVQTNPPSGYWKGEPFPITVTQSHLLFKMVRDGGVSNTSLTQHVQGDTNALRNCMTGLRRRLPPGVSIVSKKGWGYVLKVEEDSMTTVRDRVVAELPADAAGAVVIVLGADGKAVSKAYGVHPGGALVLLSTAIRGIGDKIKLPEPDPVDVNPDAI